MADMKTKPSEASVEDFLNAIEDVQKRQDAFALLDMMRETMGIAPKLWSSSIVGFGDLHYKYESGREGDWFIMGFSPRKQNFSLYFSWDPTQYENYLQRLGKHSMGKSCLYVKRLSDVDKNTLKEMIEQVARQNAS